MTTSAISGLSAALYRDEPEEYVVTANLGSNRDLCFVSKNGVTPSITIVVSGLGTSLSVVVVGNDITINSATDGAGVATSTAAQIVAAFNASADAIALGYLRLTPGSTGAGVTGALSHSHGANGVAFTELSLVDSGDHLTYQAAAGSRYWDPSIAATIEKQVHGAGGWVDITSSCEINYLRGSITVSAALNADDLVRAAGTRRSELAFRKVINLYAGKMTINNKEVDITSIDSEGWAEFLGGIRGFEFAADAFFYYNAITYPDPATTDLLSKLIAKFYSNYSGAKSWVGWGYLKGIEAILNDPNAAQKETIKFVGTHEIYPE
ncbi:MAG: hypothetical protein A4E45_00055 [Methanosaeta sp. PtaB.Bin039]|nr:MAG: hypothetical protein A4E45_00055 [Methanosaeta sp. PtaB.Bin039]